LKLFEKPDRLSRSQIWEMQKQYYLHRGMVAWDQGLIPSFMSSNAFLAQAYAEVIKAFVGDNAADGMPVRVVEMGAGSGRLAFLILKQLLRLGLDRRQFHYVMTDIAEPIIEGWRRCGAFQQFLDEGLLSFAIFDADQPENLRQIEGLNTELSGPAVLIANYVVDTLRQDAFRMRGDVLQECRVAAGSTTAEAAGELDIVKQTQLQRDFVSARLPYYDDPALDAVLRDYQNNLDDTSFLIPIGFIRCLAAFKALGKAPLLALVGDKGRLKDADLMGCADPDLVLHDGCFSFTANFNALQRYVTHQGGQALFSNDLNRGFIVAALIDGGASDEGRQFTNTKQAFAGNVERLSPRDTVILMKGMMATAENQPLEAILAMLKLCCCDPLVFMNFHSRIVELAGEAPQQHRQDLGFLMDQIWDNHYPLGTTRDVAYRVGRVFDVLGQTQRAIEIYRASLAAVGDTAKSLYRLARCLEKIGDKAEARTRAEQCLRLDPKDAHAERMLKRLGG
jgi:hypothetical protein